GNPTSAIAISPQGNPLLASGRDYNNGYLQPENRPLIRAQPMSVNGIFISGRLPLHPGQTGEGLLGHLRLLEQWDSLSVSGAMVQMGMNHYSTAPLPQRRHDKLPHYSLDQWLGSYDVALQYGPASALASQFAAPAISSEAYQTPAATDPYIELLCRAGGRCP
ncbi:MAG: hypothetical protein AAF289_03820, partial [Cyanobacteria bacterium P01_A01_bin.135]